MKKVISLFLCITIVSLCMTGCGKDYSISNNADNNNYTAVSTEAKRSAKKYGRPFRIIGRLASDYSRNVPKVGEAVFLISAALVLFSILYIILYKALDFYLNVCYNYYVR